MRPFVSVYIPTYNGEKYIKDCLDSVLAQTYQDFEVVICDDRSSDATVEIINEYARRDSRINFFQNEVNLGCVNNHKHCISLTRGEWVKPLNHDDVILENCLEEMVKRTSQDIPIISCKRGFMFSDDVNDTARAKVLKYSHVDDYFPNKTKVSAKEIAYLAVDCLGENFIGEPVVMMIRRDMFCKFDSYNPHMAIISDLEYWLRVTSNTGLVYIPEVLVHFRIHNESITGKLLSGKQQIKSRFDLLILLHEFAFSPYYVNLRRSLYERNPGIDLTETLTRLMTAVFKECSIGSQEIRQEKQREWHMLISRYPSLGLLLGRRSIFKAIGSLHKKNYKQILLNWLKRNRC